MIEAAAAQQPCRIQHQAAGQILELRAREARNVATNAFGAFALLPGFVCSTQIASSAQSVGWSWLIMPISMGGFATRGEI